MDAAKNWYTIHNIDTVDTPALAIYPDRVKDNIHTLVQSIDRVDRLRPHIKTHKSQEVVSFMLDAGITRFKCATIAEAEVLGAAGAPDVLLAYQPVGPKADRLMKLIVQFPSTLFSCLIDNERSAKELSNVCTKNNIILDVFIDLNIGMNRTGIIPTDGLVIVDRAMALPGLFVKGLHAYDGHIRDPDLASRKKKCDAAFESVVKLQEEVRKKRNKDMIIVAGGTPTYPIHAARGIVECSPGTLIYWDQGYDDMLSEQHYDFGALVLTRVISKPMPGIVCVDLGHKAIASENPITSRVKFLNASNVTPIGHSEEHMVLSVQGEDQYSVGDVLYGVPYHICPTVALYQRPAVVENNEVVAYWNTTSRNRMITI